MSCINICTTTVTSQEELDAVPLDYEGKIYVTFGDAQNHAIVRYHDRSCVIACANTYVDARENSYVVAQQNSYVEALWNSTVVAQDYSYVVAWASSHVEAQGHSCVVARDWCHVLAEDNSYVVARDSSSVKAQDTSCVEARDCSYVDARDSASVRGYDHAQIVDSLFDGQIEVTGNARIVRYPQTVDEYCNTYDIKRDDTTGRFFTFLHKEGSQYFEDCYKKNEYKIGETIRADQLDIAHLNWVLAKQYRNGTSFAIVEVEAKLDNVVVPPHSTGQLRCSEITIIREVPLEECGVYGKILAKKNRREELQHEI